MRRGWAIGATLLVALLTVGIAVGAYNAGLDEGVRRAADSSQVVTVVGDRYGHGFFPFGFFLFPLLIIGTFLLIGKAFRGPRGHWGHDHSSFCAYRSIRQARLCVAAIRPSFDRQGYIA